MIATAATMESASTRVEVTLPGGDRVSLVPVTQASTAAMAQFLDRLSPESRRLRFFQALPVVPPAMVRQLCDVDHHEHVAWLAMSADGPVAEGRYVRSRSAPWQAEVAVAVRDDWRRRGLARLMVETIGVVADARSVTTFTCDVLGENRASQRLFGGLGVTFRFEDGMLAGAGPVPAWSGSPAVADEIRRVQAAFGPAVALEAVA
jgi:GNAT superfamily N-acetyltransferase